MLRTASARQFGFNLIELMVALVLGLLVILAVLALTVSAMQSSSQTVSSTRLNQELRALTEIIGRDVRRARYSEMAMTNIGMGPAAVTPFDAVTVTDQVGATNDSDGNAATTQDGDCIQYSYQFAPNGAYRTISYAVVGARGVVRLSGANAASPACDEGGATVISSPDVNITQLSFNFWPKPRDSVTVTVAGSLVSDPTVVRRYTETVRFRSAAR